VLSDAQSPVYSTVDRGSATDDGSGNFSVTVSCTSDQTAIGAGYSGLDAGTQVLGSAPGGNAEDWVLTFNQDPGAGAKAAPMCAKVTVAP
jgi:hypothetical protein